MLLKRKLPVVYRWLRRRRYFPHAVVLSCALVFLPAGFVGGVKISRTVSVNKALAATRALSPEQPVHEALSDVERRHYAEALGSLVIDEPGRLRQLVGRDMLVMFREPDLRREEGGASMWQYRTESCVLDVYFRATGEIGHYEVRRRMTAMLEGGSRDTGGVNEAVCFKSIYKQRAIQAVFSLNSHKS